MVPFPVSYELNFGLINFVSTCVCARARVRVYASERASERANGDSGKIRM